MAGSMAANYMLNVALRALQLICAIVVMGTDGYTLHVFRGHSTIEHSDFRGFTTVPNAWAFLMFCAGWTVLVVIFQTVAGDFFAGRASIGYIRVVAEVLALLSWFASWIALHLESSHLPREYKSCEALEVATFFEAVEWLLFTVTTFQSFNSSAYALSQSSVTQL
ncbi:hypothetical protein EK21DRAFT_105306 [Setomelanomma holmii]|uniref:MARVEL domain-containing protein n=1 Tax=Setomelanomma holmii TaxID=210430 RepID=A0A9P4LFQ1_9PLEO|nr:hypothetical protein EK21DRAFT_105306 [Setomelanomma holmii]